MLFWIGLFPLVVSGGDCTLLEGASGKVPDGFCWAAPSEHNPHAINQVMMSNQAKALGLSRITDSPQITGISRWRGGR